MTDDAPHIIDCPAGDSAAVARPERAVGWRFPPDVAAAREEARRDAYARDQMSARDAAREAEWDQGGGP